MAGACSSPWALAGAGRYVRYHPVAGHRGVHPRHRRAHRAPAGAGRLGRRPREHGARRRVGGGRRGRVAAAHPTSPPVAAQRRGRSAHPRRLAAAPGGAGGPAAVVVATVVVAARALPVATIGALPSGCSPPPCRRSTWADLRVLVARRRRRGPGRPREPAVGDGRRRDERVDAARPRPRAVRPGPGQPRLPAARRHPRHGGHRPHRRQRALGRPSRLAAVVHSLVLLVVVLALAAVVAWIPLAALAGVLIATAVRMVEVSSLRVLRASVAQRRLRARPDLPRDGGARPGDGRRARHRRGRSASRCASWRAPPRCTRRP